MDISEDIRYIFDAMNEGILIIDTDARIVFANRSYRRFLTKEGLAEGERVEGRLLTQLRPGARLPQVVRSGEPVIQAERREAEDIYFVNMYPLVKDGEVRGGISVVTFMEDASGYRDKVSSIEKRNRQLLSRLSSSSQRQSGFDDIVARAPRSAECKAFAMSIAASDRPVMICAENGCGKDIYAAAIHSASGRSGGVFVPVNCAAAGSHALEEELFGFNGPGGYRAGLIEAAEGGTLVLDEISGLDAETQYRLIRILQTGSYRHAGSLNEVPVDVRFIATSTVDPKALIKDGRLMADLYYLISTFRIDIPPLRERMEDLPYLARQMSDEISDKFKRRIYLSDGAMNALMRHDWPGNIRELRSVLELAAYKTEDGYIRASSLPDNLDSARVSEALPLYGRVKAFEKAEIQKALDFYGRDLNGKKAAARELGISLASLYAKLKS